METCEIREIIYGSAEYTQELALRDKVLRRPLGMNLYEEDLSAEKDDLHFGAFLGGRLVGTLVLSHAQGDEMRMRQVAVAQETRGQGIGRHMVRFAQEAAARKGCRKIILHARKTAVPFYEKLGYEISGAEFFEVTIPHRPMFLDLADAAE